jgi:protein translocase SecG subunit
MATALSIFQMISGVLLVVLILVQSKGTGLGSTFGGDMGFYATKRGAEKMLFVVTIVLSAFFLLSLLVSVVI